MDKPILSDYFEISGRIFRSGCPFEVSLRGRYFQRTVSTLRKEGELHLMWLHEDGVKISNGDPALWAEYEEAPIRYEDTDSEVLYFRMPALPEGPVTCILRQKIDESSQNDICTIKLYILDNDLFTLRPYRGDMHMHSSFSACGSRVEDPHYVAAIARKHGLDFIAVTDHAQIEGSEALDGFTEKYSSDFRIYHGEECHHIRMHLPSFLGINKFYSWNHIVNFGGRDGVCRYANEHFEQFNAEIDERAKTISQEYPELMRKAMAASDWIFDKIHEFGGIAIFCHPFWRPNNRTNLPKPVREYIMRNAKFDVLELPGLGSSGNLAFYEENMMAQAWWQDCCRQSGKFIPVVGNTDSHNARTLLGLNFTLVFAESNSFESIADALRNGRSIGVVYDAEKEVAPRYFGSLRLTRYAMFLMNEFYPEHNELCAAEGALMLENLRGHDCCADVVSAFAKGRISRLFERYFGK